MALTYGLRSPRDLLKKLERHAALLDERGDDWGKRGGRPASRTGRGSPG